MKKCFLCGFSTDDEAALAEHMRLQHQGGQAGPKPPPRAMSEMVGGVVVAILAIAVLYWQVAIGEQTCRRESELSNAACSFSWVIFVVFVVPAAAVGFFAGTRLARSYKKRT